MMKSTILRENHQQINGLLDNLLGNFMHSKRLTSLCNAVAGALSTQSLRISEIGRGLAQANGVLPKHAIKQVDRLLSNDGIDVELCQNKLVSMLISSRKEILVAMDWTIFGKDQQLTITLRLVTRHGRATPLLWLTVNADDLKGKKRGYENQLLQRLRVLLPPKTKVTVLADREFGTVKRLNELKEYYKFDFIIRFKGNMMITDHNGEIRSAREWLGFERHKTFRDALITHQHLPIEKVVVCREPMMKDIWCLACSDGMLSTRQAIEYYGKRWSTEASYRDEKNIVFGMGMKNWLCVLKEHKVII